MRCFSDPAVTAKKQPNQEETFRNLAVFTEVTSIIKLVLLEELKLWQRNTIIFMEGYRNFFLLLAQLACSFIIWLLVI